MQDTALCELVRRIPGAYWSEMTVYYVLAQRLLAKGFTQEEALDILTEAYHAARRS